MGFSGYFQLLCEHGHLWLMDCYQYDFAKVIVCPYCNAPPAWRHMVDTTNDEGNPVKLEVLYPELKRACSTCGQSRIVRRGRYKIPRDAGWTLEGYNDLDSGHDTQHDEQAATNPEE